MVFLNFFPFFSQEKFLLQKDYKTSRQLLENDNLYFGANLSFVCRLADILCSGYSDIYIFSIEVEFWLAWNVVMNTSCVLCFSPTKLFEAVEMEGWVEGALKQWRVFLCK